MISRSEAPGATVTGYAIVFLGAGLGGLLRHAINELVIRGLGGALPWSTATVNVTGSFALGLIAGYFAGRGSVGESARLFLTTGLLGGYTTFSTFSLDVVSLWARGARGLALLYIIGSLALALCGVVSGLLLARRWLT